MGGGFDVFCGLPIYFELQQRGYKVHLANLTYSPIHEYKVDTWLTPSLVGIGSNSSRLSGYHPEYYLARWFHETKQERTTIWCFDSTGVVPLVESYRKLIETLKIEGIVLIDGGVDSLARGDEEMCGTVMEDFASLVAVSALQEIPIRIMACVGMGVEGDISHALILENIAEITKQGGFLGSSTLLPQVPACQKYESALEYVHKQPNQQPSVVNTSILSAMKGHFGNHHSTERTRGSELWISPLMSLYWFFSIDAVAEQNLFRAQLLETNSIQEVFGTIYEGREQIALRSGTSIRLS
jgi:hypothetical protein